MAGRGGQLCCRRLFSYVSPTGRVCVERHIAICYVLCAMCTGQHGAVAVSGEMYDVGMGGPHAPWGSIVCFIHRLMAGLGTTLGQGYRTQKLRNDLSQVIHGKSNVWLLPRSVGTSLLQMGKGDAPPLTVPDAE